MARCLLWLRNVKRGFCHTSNITPSRHSRFFTTNGSNNKNKHDTLMTRMLGSDWGDRSKQPISLTMKVYWSVFIVVVTTGIIREYLQEKNDETDVSSQEDLRKRMLEFQKSIKKND